MASVFYLVDDGLHIEEDIVQKYLKDGEWEKLKYFSCVAIQKVWRGYRVRQMVKKWNCAAIIIQKYVRGWLTRLNLDKTYKEIYKYKCEKYYNDMATKIQSAFRGYLVRKMVNIKKNIAERKRIQEENDKMILFIREQQELIQQKEKEEEEKNNLLSIATILLDRHHLLRTEQKEGILSLQGKKELSYLEELLEIIPWKEYMKKLRKIYNENYSQEKASLRVEKKCENITSIPKNKITNKEPFNLYTQNIKYSKYESLLSSSGKYEKTKISFRCEDKSKNISKTDFNLYNLKTMAQSKNIPPYFIDVWFGECNEMKFCL